MIYLAAMITNSADNNETIRFNEIKPIISPTLQFFTHLSQCFYIGYWFTLR